MYDNSLKTRNRLAVRTTAPYSRHLRIEPLEARQLLTATAVDDSYDVSKNVALTIDSPGVLANDTDSGGLALSALVDHSPAHGSLILDPSGSFTYIPNTGYTGPDSFTYTASDGSATSNVATVSLTVSNNAPVIVPQNYILNENLPLTVMGPGLLTGASDVNGDTLSAVLVDAPANGNVVVSPGGGFTYTPNANYAGTDTFTYRASDGSLNSTVATVSMTVDAVTQPPTSANESYHVGENGALGINTNPRTSVITVPQTFNSLVYDANNGLVYGDTNSSIQSINPQTGALGTPVPVSATLGKMVISTNGQYIYAVANGGGSVLRFNMVNQTTDMIFSLPADLVVGTMSAIPGRPQSVLISMRYPDLSPPAGGTDVFQNGVALPDHVGQGAGTGGPDQSFVDPNGVDAFGFTNTDSSYGFVFMAIDNNGIHTLSTTGHPFSGPVGVMSEADGLVFSSAGQAVSLTTDQSIGSWSGGANYTLDIPNNKLFSIVNNGSTQTLFSYVLDTMAPINSFNVPIAGDSANLIRFGQSGLAFLAANGQTVLVQSDLISGDPYRGVLADNTDPLDLPLTAELQTNVQHGTLSLNANGTFTYTPNPGYFGTDSFTYESSNGTLNSALATVTLHVDAPPLASGNSYAVGENTTASINAAQGVLMGATDLNGYPLSASLVSAPKHGTLTLMADGSFTYVPANNYVGTDSFTFTASDGYASSAAATVNLHVNAAPSLIPAQTTATVASAGGILNYTLAPTITDANVSGAGDELELTVGIGTLTVPTGTSGVTIVAGTNGGSSLTIQGSLAQLDSALTHLTYSPNGGGTTLTITPIDPSSGVGGAALIGVTGSVVISVIPLHAPIVTNSATLENTQSTSGLVITPNGQDVGAVTNFQITGITGGLLFLSDGQTPVVNGQFITLAQGAAGLAFTPTADSTSPGSFAVQSSTSANVSGLGGTSTTATITISMGTPPTSSITTESARTSMTSIPVGWMGSPGSAGAPIASFNIFVSTDGGPFTPWLTGTTSTSAAFPAELGHTYGFTSQATDTIGNVEPAHVTADATIVTMATPWHNANNPLDVLDNGGPITPIDALVIINYLNANGSNVALPAIAPATSFYVDVLDEDSVFPLDVLQVINYLNAAQAPTNMVSSSVATPSSQCASSIGNAAKVMPAANSPANPLSAVDAVLSGLQPAQSVSPAVMSAGLDNGFQSPVPSSAASAPNGTVPLAAKTLATAGSRLKSSGPQATAVDALLGELTSDWINA